MRPVYLGWLEPGNQLMTLTGCRGIGGQRAPEELLTAHRLLLTEDYACHLL
jgi:hypothetical protein